MLCVCVCVCLCKGVERNEHCILRNRIKEENKHCILCADDISILCVHVCVRAFAQVCVIKVFLHDLLQDCILQ